MNDAVVGYWSDVATIAAGVLAAVGLIATAISLRANARSNDLSSLFMVLREIGDAESRLAQSLSNAEEFRKCLNSYLNLLETLAAAINNKLLNKVTRTIAKDRLVNDLAILQSNDASKDAFEKAITSPDTFMEIRLFFRRHRTPIERQTRMLNA